MKQNQLEQLQASLLAFLQQLHIDDSAIREQLCEHLLKRFEPFFAEISYEKSVKILRNQALRLFNNALAKYLNIDDHDLLTAARAKLLSQKTATDFLFGSEHLAKPDITKLTQHVATPTAAPLLMPAQTLQFIFDSVEPQGTSS